MTWVIDYGGHIDDNSVPTCGEKLPSSSSSFHDTLAGKFGGIKYCFKCAPWILWIIFADSIFLKKNLAQILDDFIRSKLFMIHTTSFPFSHQKNPSSVLWYQHQTLEMCRLLVVLLLLALLSYLDVRSCYSWQFPKISFWKQWVWKQCPVQLKDN